MAELRIDFLIVALLWCGLMFNPYLKQECILPIFIVVAKMVALVWKVVD